MSDSRGLSSAGVAPLGRIAAPLREQVIQALRDAILEFRFKPGQRLIERELIELLGVSRTTIREAIRDLASEGLVTVVPQKGAIVSAPTAAEAADLYDVRASLESMVVSRFVARATPDQVVRLRETVDAMTAVTETNPHDAVGVLRAKDAFYEILIEGADSDVLAQLLGGLQARVRLLRATSLAAEGRAVQAAAEIRGVMEAVEAGDGDLAAERTAAHVQAASVTALAAITGAVGGRDDDTPFVA